MNSTQTNVSSNIKTISNNSPNKIQQTSTTTSHQIEPVKAGRKRFSRFSAENNTHTHTYTQHTNIKENRRITVQYGGTKSKIDERLVRTQS